MTKILKILATSLLLACIMTVTFAGAAFAGNGYGSPDLCDGDPVVDHDQHQFGRQ